MYKGLRIVIVLERGRSRIRQMRENDRSETRKSLLDKFLVFTRFSTVLFKSEMKRNVFHLIGIY